MTLLYDGALVESPFATKAQIDETGVTSFLERLDATIRQGWTRIQEDRYFAHVSTRGYDARLYQLTMVQMYHYTRHNSINQAIAAGRVSPERLGLLKFCYKHAREELGHENFVLHDLKAVGLLDRAMVEAPPLPATEAFIGYLYNVCREHGAVARLGYSAWAEASYEYANPLIVRARKDLNLTDAHMTFMVAHHRIDLDHAREVREEIAREILDKDEQEAVLQVTRTTLWLFRGILDNILEEYLSESANHKHRTDVG